MKKRKIKLLININVEDRAIIPGQNISVDKSLDIIKKEDIDFVLFVDEIRVDVEEFTLSIGIYKKEQGFLAKGKVQNMYLPSSVFPQIALSVKEICFSGYEEETVIKSAIALVIAKDCFLEFIPKKQKIDDREKIELILSYKGYEGTVRFSNVIDTTRFILSSKGYKNPRGYLLCDKKYLDVVIFERKKT